MQELKNKRVFIVEDDATNMAVFAVSLRQSGASIVQDPWNRQTLSILKSNMPVDAILLDLMLKNNISGYDIYDQIRSVPELAYIPVIIVSAADPSIQIPKAKAKGFSGFIGKPISPILLPKQVAQCIAGEKVWYVR